MPQFINVRGKAEDILKADSQMQLRTVNRIFDSIHLAKIIECEKNEDGEYTGKATVQLLTTGGIRKNCIIPVPAGQSMWNGGLPQAGTMCTLGWLPMGVGIILAIYPFHFRRLIENRNLQNLEPGELFFQASSGVTKEEQEAEGKILLDRHGRIMLQRKEGDATIIIGDPSEANGLVTESAEDEGTGENTLLRIESNDAKINLTENGSVSILQGDTKVTLKSGNITIEGENVDVNGDEGVNVDGLNVDIKGDASVNVEGATINLRGAVSIQGGTVGLSSPSINISASDSLEMASPDGKRLATEDFVFDIFNSHKHGPGTFNVPGSGNVIGESEGPDPTADSAHLTINSRLP